MVIVPGTALFVLFLLLSTFHFYWAFGGKWGIESVIPAMPSGKASFKPGVVGTLTVAIGLLGFGLFYLMASVGSDFPSWASVVGWVIPSIFLVRAIGEFRYVGFFKKVVGTKFSKMDTIFFSPLCLLIACLGYGVMLIS